MSEGFLNIDFNKTYQKLGLNKFLMGTASKIIPDQSDFTPTIKQDAMTDRATVTKTKLAQNAVGSSALGSAVVTTINLIDGAVSENKIASYAVTNSKLGTQAVSNAKLGSQCITSDKLSDYVVLVNKIGTAAVTDEKINDFSWNKGTTGTATFGGTTNSNGYLRVLNSGGTESYSFGSAGMLVAGTSVTIDNNNGTSRLTYGALVAKTAIVPTNDGYSALYCVESPGVWFMDFCDSIDHVDQKFLQVTEGPLHFVSCLDGGFQVWAKRKGMESVRFEKKTEEDYIKNNKFWENK